ncbi:MAG: hypothetical protein AB7N76_12625 [Planctomycetota bacterium]
MSVTGGGSPSIPEVVDAWGSLRAPGGSKTSCVRLLGEELDVSTRTLYRWLKARCVPEDQQANLKRVLRRAIEDCTSPGTSTETIRRYLADPSLAVTEWDLLSSLERSISCAGGIQGALAAVVGRFQDGLDSVRLRLEGGVLDVRTAQHEIRSRAIYAEQEALVLSPPKTGSRGELRMVNTSIEALSSTAWLEPPLSMLIEAARVQLSRGRFKCARRLFAIKLPEEYSAAEAENIRQTLDVHLQHGIAVALFDVLQLAERSPGRQNLAAIGDMAFFASGDLTSWSVSVESCAHDESHDYFTELAERAYPNNEDVWILPDQRQSVPKLLRELNFPLAG